MDGAENMLADVVTCLDRSLSYIGGLIADLGDADLVLQPAGAPNHAAWTLGHLAHSWHAIAIELGAAPWLPDEWERLFGYGSSPAQVAASGHPSAAELRAWLGVSGERLRAALLAASEEGLREPLANSASREVFVTKGDAVLQVVCAHTAFHAGQLAAWRRAVGRGPAGVFI